MRRRHGHELPAAAAAAAAGSEAGIGAWRLGGSRGTGLLSRHLP